MITSKQRATLRSQSNGLETIFQIGKGGITDNLIRQTEDALKAREMIKLRVLETAPAFAQETAQELAALTGSEVVQVIGTRIVLYRRNDKDPKIEL